METLETREQRAIGKQPETTLATSDKLNNSVSREEFLDSSYLGPDAIASKELEVLSELRGSLGKCGVDLSDVRSLLKPHNMKALQALHDSLTLSEAQVTIDDHGRLQSISSLTMEEFKMQLAQLTNVYEVVDLDNVHDATIDPAGIEGLLREEPRYTMTFSTEIPHYRHHVDPFNFADLLPQSSIISSDYQDMYLERDKDDTEQLGEKEEREILSPPTLLPGAIHPSHFIADTIIYDDDDDDDDNNEDEGRED
jgi:hypothetical protein